MLVGRLAELAEYIKTYLISEATAIVPGQPNSKARPALEHVAENGIDVSALPHLTDQDLKDMGSPGGHGVATSKSRVERRAIPEHRGRLQVAVTTNTTTSSWPLG